VGRRVLQGIEQLCGIVGLGTGCGELIGGGQSLLQSRVDLRAPVLGPGLSLRQQGRGARPEQPHERSCRQLPDPVSQIVQRGIVRSHGSMVAMPGIAFPNRPLRRR